MVSTADRAEVDKLFVRIIAVSEDAELDNFPVIEYDEQGSLRSPQGENREVEHRHTTLKLSCPTRWNSTLAMVESIVDAAWRSPECTQETRSRLAVSSRRRD